ncbi:Lrp/AsnC family transcriptional regulator [archaeon]|jgi:Lrp/AsnC family transcriptional regulator, leucine-responsive regulatory protein|nr:Lrp/AsnC family transcriptional regulator [archaeon]MBT3465046.1 Lrp/AsnC family transcriptional regulator [archaeon]MBT6869281.1 Lrp/AsnC family transcriptional regulator [archaeon]MBT7193679.1 Lrp/AsnC family transcriptional regulator [archaeon]MBT7381209.1 Lrp/AsnC family transcriptional regulator [archaeon]
MIKSIDLKDKQILYQLELDARQSYSQIAKKTKTSKEVVKYRIDRLKEKGIINKFVLMINGPKLGYSAYKLYLKLRNISEKELNIMINDFKKNENIAWIVTCYGKYDLIIGTIAKDNYESFEINNQIQKDYQKFIHEVTPLNHIDIRHQKRTYIVDKKRTDKYSPFWGGKTQNYKLDEYEKAILSKLCENARKPIIKIASELKSPVDNIHRRLKKLIKDKIIEGSKVSLNKGLLEIQSYKILLQIRFQSLQKEKEFFNRSYQQNNIVNVVRMMGSWNYELDIDVTNITQLNEIMTELKNNFAEEIISYDTLQIFKQYKYNFFPIKDQNPKYC